MDESAAKELFDANAATYDRVNDVISLGLDSRWYAWAARQAAERNGAIVLDAFAGTGEVGLRAARLGAEVTLVDASERMLDVARNSALLESLDVRCIVADLTAEPLTIKGAPFDAITVMWGLRYLDDPARVLRNLGALLGQGGKLVVVEFVEPERGLISSLAGFYFFHMLPRIAAALAGRRQLYNELVATTRAMGPKSHLVGIVESAGFEVRSIRVMGFGLVCGIVATPKASES